MALDLLPSASVFLKTSYKYHFQMIAFALMHNYFRVLYFSVHVVNRTAIHEGIWSESWQRSNMRLFLTVASGYVMYVKSSFYLFCVSGSRKESEFSFACFGKPRDKNNTCLVQKMITVKKLSKVPLTFRPQLPSSHISDCIEVDTAKGHQIANFCELLPLLSFQNYSGTGNWILRVLNAPKKGRWLG